VSDAWRRGVRPARGRIAFDGDTAQPLAWRDGRLFARDREGGTAAAVTVVLADGTRLAIEFAGGPVR